MNVEYIAIVLALIATISLTVALNPRTMFKTSINILIKFLNENEGKVIMTLYNALPSDIKKKAGSKMVADIMSHGIKIIVGFLEESISKK